MGLPMSNTIFEFDLSENLMKQKIEFLPMLNSFFGIFANKKKIENLIFEFDLSENLMKQKIEFLPMLISSFGIFAL